LLHAIIYKIANILLLVLKTHLDVLLLNSSKIQTTNTKEVFAFIFLLGWHVFIITA